MQIDKKAVKYNSCYDFILVVIDNFSRKLYSTFIFKNEADDVARRLERIFKQLKHYQRYIAK
jgi:hypothetical protein